MSNPNDPTGPCAGDHIWPPGANPLIGQPSLYYTPPPLFADGSLGIAPPPPMQAVNATRLSTAPVLTDMGLRPPCLGFDFLKRQYIGV